jgi:hypothetical protein
MKRLANVTIWYPNGNSELFRDVEAETDGEMVYWWTDRKAGKSIMFSGLPYRVVFGTASEEN